MAFIYSFPILNQFIVPCLVLTVASCPAYRFLSRQVSWVKAQHSENKDHGIWSQHFMANRWGNSGNCQTLFFGAPKSLEMVIAAMKLKDAYSLEEKL